MVVKAVVLGIIFFIFDLIIFGLGVLKKTPGKKSTKEIQKLKNELKLIIPMVLFIQVFFAVVLVFTYAFAISFKMFTRDFTGSLSFSVIFFLPILYILINCWLWGDRKFNAGLATTVISWLAKFIISGVYFGLLS